ncbi:MAG: ribonuclease HI [Streptococcaceae bacterium]|nr:ribonuclease HI [Streptococcaceae bacterium]
MTEIIVYTDGGSRNTGNVKGGNVKKTDKAAWAYLIQNDSETIEGSKGFLGATNNQMELTAVLEALRELYRRKLNDEAIVLVSDSQYVLKGITQWLAGWKRNNWRTASKQPVKNVELWQVMDRALNYFPNIRFEWTKGHAGNYGNERVDDLLNQTMDQL